MSTPQRNRSNRSGSAASRTETEAAPPPSAPPPGAAEAKLPLARMGDILKREREKRGDDLQQIADYLCIRRIFLEAIENSRYDELPADAYVIGFLRSYASYLGLDGAEAIDRYRKEMFGRRRRPELSVPTPIAEGRTPSAAIMASAAVAALVIYALWYGLSSSDRTEVSVPPPLPSAASAPVAATNTTAMALTAASPLELSPTPSASASPAATAATGGSGDNPVMPATTASAPPTAVPAAATVTTAKTADTSATADSAAAKATDTNPAAAASPNGVKVYGDTTSDSRISIRAEKESWILIADEKGRTVFDRVLKPGDVYRVPDVDGLSLTAGNGNGIVLSIDGEDLPKLAGRSLVLRNISLDPDNLKSATSTSRE